MSRKYRHSGYQDSGDDDRSEDRRPPQRRQDLSFEEKIQRKSMRHAIDRDTREVLRCHTCGYIVEDHGAVGFTSTCGKCQAALHCCRNCTHFASDARWQCRATIEEPVSDKLKNNECRQFEARLALDHTGRRSRSAPAGGGSRASSNDPKEAFHNLFKR